MKKTHKKQLIDLNKIFRGLQKLKGSGNPYYQNIMKPEKYEENCEKENKEWYKAIYGTEVDSDDSLDCSDSNIVT